MRMRQLRDGRVRLILWHHIEPCPDDEARCKHRCLHQCQTTSSQAGWRRESGWNLKVA